jgi:flagellin
MTIDLGNAAAGTYNFSVTTKLESAAVAGKKPDSVELVIGDASGYFNNASVANTVSLSSGAAESALLNGNYKLSAEYGDDGNITVTAKGDNGQTFEAKIYASDLENLATAADADRTIKMTFNAEAGDAFEVTLGLTSNIASTKNNFDTLAQNISKTSVSISGGVTKKDAVYGVYANLTGAESVKLQAGMSSVSFSNGVKVNFDTLTASSVDTANEAVIGSTGGSITTPSVDVTNLLNAGSSGANAASLAVTDTNDALAIGDFTIGVSGGFVTITDAKGNVFTSLENTTIADPTSGNVKALTFKDSEGNTVTGLTANLTYTGGTLAVNPVSLNDGTGSVSGNVSLTASTLATGASAAFSNFSVTDDSIIANGNMTIATSTSGSDTIFTATDHAGNVYTAKIATADMKSSTSGGSVTNTLTFTTDKGQAGFSIDLITTNNGANGVTFNADSTNQITLNVENAGHNYARVFSGSTTDMSATTASSFSVEEKANAGLTFQVGANEGDEMTIFIDKMDSSYLGVASSSVGTREAASAAIGAVDRAINQVSSQRAYLGAIQNRLDHKIANLNTSAENLTSAESQIRDVDMAKEMTNFTNANILAQAATAMLAQANSLPQGVLSLLG